MLKFYALMVSAGIVIAGCAAGEEASTTTLSSTPTTTGSATSTSQLTDTTTTTGAAATSTTGSSSSGGDDCVVGTWTLDSEAFVENFGAIMTEAGMPDAEVAALDGTFMVEMNGDGSYLAVRDGWGFSLGTPQGNVVIEINGSEMGTWSTTGSTLNINPGESDLTVESSVEVDGQLLPLPGSDLPVETPPGLATNSEFDCTGEVLTLRNAGVESVLNRN